MSPQKRQASWVNSPLRESQYPWIIGSECYSQRQLELLKTVLDLQRFSEIMPPIDRKANRRVLNNYHWLDRLCAIPLHFWRVYYKNVLGWNKNQRTSDQYGYIINGVVCYFDLATVFQRLNVEIVYYPGAGEDRIPRFTLGLNGHERIIHLYRTDGNLGIDKMEPPDDIIDIEIAGDVRQSPLKDCSVDAIFFRAAFICPKDSNRILKNGGYVIIDEENHGSSLNVKTQFYLLGYRNVMRYHGIQVLQKRMDGLTTPTLKGKLLSIGCKSDPSGLVC